MRKIHFARGEAGVTERWRPRRLAWLRLAASPAIAKMSVGNAAALGYQAKVARQLGWQRDAAKPAGEDASVPSAARLSRANGVATAPPTPPPLRPAARSVRARSGPCGRRDTFRRGGGAEGSGGFRDCP